MAGGGLRPGGLLQLRDSQGVDQPAGPLQPARFQDRGELWDAWDLARITAAIPWRFRCRDPASCWSMAPWSSRRSALPAGIERHAIGHAIAGRLPWLELICIDWASAMNLRLERPLSSLRVRARRTPPARSWSGRPWRTRRGSSRGGSATDSWLATQAKARGRTGGLAGWTPGVDVVPERIGVSLLRSDLARGGSWLAPSATGADASQRHLEQGMRPSGGDRFPGAGMEGPLAGLTIAAMVHLLSENWCPWRCARRRMDWAFAVSIQDHPAAVGNRSTVGS